MHLVWLSEWVTHKLPWLVSVETRLKSGQHCQRTVIWWVEDISVHNSDIRRKHLGKESCSGCHDYSLCVISQYWCQGLQKIHVCEWCQPSRLLWIKKGELVLFMLRHHMMWTSQFTINFVVELLWFYICTGAKQMVCGILVICDVKGQFVLILDDQQMGSKLHVAMSKAQK
jgi:hypothetical protein